MILYVTGFLLLGVTLYAVHVIVKKRSEGKRQMRVSLAYYRMVKKAKLAVENSELLKGRVIGLDRKNKKLLLIDHNKLKKQEQCIALTEIASCEVHEVKDQSNNSIKEIYLEFKPKTNNKHYRFCFFDESKDTKTDLPFLKKQALSWKNRIDVHKYPSTVNRAFEYVL